MRASARGMVVLSALLALGAAEGCGEGVGDVTAPPAATPKAAPSAPRAPLIPAKPALADGAAIFQVRCASCHGDLGDGHGPASAGLEPPPRDFRDPAWQDSVSDAHIEAVIARGGTPSGLSALMPPHPDLAADPGQLAALRAHVRSLER